MQKEKGKAGFTLLELIMVLFLITLMMGISVVFFANTLPSAKFNGAVRELSAAMRHARALSQIRGEKQHVSIDMDAKRYSVPGRGEKALPSGTEIKVTDTSAGDISRGQYDLIFYPAGNSAGGSILIWNEKRSARIDIDPVVGAVIIK